MIQYGIPADSSAPTEPYMKRSSPAICGCGTTRKKLYQANHARSASTISATMPAVCHLRLMRTSSKRLHVFDDVVFVGVGQLRAPRPPVPGVAARALGGVVEPVRLRPFARHVADEADLHRIDHVVAAIELLRAL